jgi:hypothetical protein
MHIFIIIGGFIAQVGGGAMGALVLLIAMKTAADLGSHLFGHRGSSFELALES